MVVGYLVNPSDRSVVHNPTGAFFRYDEAGALRLLNPQTIARGEETPLIAEGAKEALRQEVERDPRIRLIWLA